MRNLVDLAPFDVLDRLMYAPLGTTATAHRRPVPEFATYSHRLSFFALYRLCRKINRYLSVRLALW